VYTSDTRLPPSPGTNGALVFDTGTNYSKTMGGGVNQLLHGAVGSPTWGPVDLTSEVTGVLPVVSGGTGASSASSARSNLGLIIGTDVIGTSSGSVGAKQIDSAAFRMFFVNGRLGAGSFRIDGIKAGDVISNVIDLSSGPGQSTNVTTAFSSAIVTNNSASQISTTDYSTAGLLFLIIAKGG
jgi:hypothetical protein